MSSALVISTAMGTMIWFGVDTPTVGSETIEMEALTATTLSSLLPQILTFMVECECLILTRMATSTFCSGDTPPSSTSLITRMA